MATLGQLEAVADHTINKAMLFIDPP